MSPCVSYDLRAVSKLTDAQLCEIISVEVESRKRSAHNSKDKDKYNYSSAIDVSKQNISN